MTHTLNDEETRPSAQPQGQKITATAFAHTAAATLEGEIAAQEAIALVDLGRKNSPWRPLASPQWGSPLPHRSS